MEPARPLRTGLARWLPTEGSAAGRVVRGAVAVGLLSAAVKVVSLAKELCVAKVYGRADDLDAFLMALLVPATVAGIVGGAFHQAVVPIYARVRARSGEQAAREFFARCLGGGAVAGAGAAIVVAAAAAPLLSAMASGFPPDKLAHATRMMWTLAPLAVVAAWTTMVSAALHAAERYGAVASVPVFTPAATLFAVVAAGSGGGWPLVAGATIGALLEAVALTSYARSRGVRVAPSWPGGFDPDVREVFAQALPAMAAMGLHTATGVVEQVMAARLASGSVAALGYAYRLVAAPLGLATVALGTASFAVLSSLRAAEGSESFRRAVRRLAVRVAVAVVAGAATLAAVSPWLVAVVYQRGRFAAEDAALVGDLVRIYALMMPPYVVGILGVKVLAVTGRNRRIVPISAVNLAASVGANITLVHWLGIRGIAWASVLVYMLSCGQIWWAIRGAGRERS